MNKTDSKLTLGTVQFGLNYGINNRSGLINDKELHNILSFAADSGITTLDTAYNYGKSEERIGEIQTKSEIYFKIISKAPQGANRKNLEDFVEKSLKRLNSSSFYGYILHDFNDYLKDKYIVERLTHLKYLGKTKKIGFSLYYPEQLELLFSDNVTFDLIQIPYNLADRRFERYFKELKKMNVDIHTRSVFLQGLFFMNLDSLPEKLKSFSALILKINYLSKILDRSTENIALNYVFQNNYIDNVLIGVDSEEQLKKNVKEIKRGLTDDKIELINKEISEVSIQENLLIPSNWN